MAVFVPSRLSDSEMFLLFAPSDFPSRLSILWDVPSHMTRQRLFGLTEVNILCPNSYSYINSSKDLILDPTKNNDKLAKFFVENDIWTAIWSVDGEIVQPGLTWSQLSQLFDIPVWGVSSEGPPNIVCNVSMLLSRPDMCQVPHQDTRGNTNIQHQVPPMMVTIQASR